MRNPSQIWEGFRGTIVEMPSDFYKAYLKSAKWKNKREQVFRHYGRRCYACRSAPRIIHVHHLTYERLGNERMGDLIPLCVPCHKQVTRLYRSPGGRQKGNRRVTMEFVRYMREQRYVNKYNKR